MRTRCEIKNGSVRMESARRNDEFHVVQRLFALAVLQFGDGAQLQNLRAAFHRRQMRQQNRRRIVLVVIQRKSRIRQLARLRAILQSPNRICSTPATRPAPAFAAAARTGNTFVFGRQRAIIILPRLQIGQRCAFAQLPPPLVGQSRIICSRRCISSRFNDIGVVAASDFMPCVLSSIAFVTAGNNRRQRKILVVRHGRRNECWRNQIFRLWLPIRV